MLPLSPGINLLAVAESWSGPTAAIKPDHSQCHLTLACQQFWLFLRQTTNMDPVRVLQSQQQSPPFSSENLSRFLM